MYNTANMFNGGYVNKPRSAQVFRYAGLLVALVLIIYGLFVQQCDINNVYNVGFTIFVIFSFWWLYLGIIHYIFPIQEKLDCYLRLIAYHLLAGSYLIFISGFTSPLTALWLILTLASFVYLSKLGFVLNILVLCVFASIDVVFEHGVIAYNLAAVASIITTGIFIVLVSRYQEISKKELSNSKAQESLQRDSILTIVNNLADAVLSTDLEGTIRIYNAASLNLLDTNISLKGRHIDEILPLSDQDGKDVSIFKEFQKAKTVVMQDNLNYIVSDDEKMRLEITFSPIRSSYSRSKKIETHDGYIIILRDITKAKSLEEERDEFISVVSHELRTPIAIAEGTISNVQVMMKHPDATNSMLTDAIEVAHEQVMFLASMVNDLSTLSRAERGVANNAEDIDVQALAIEMHKKYTDAAKAKKLHLNLDLSPKINKVHVSKLYLEELLQNFITNAIKYTKKGSVTIIVKQEANQLTIAVKDTGIGISKSDQKRIFEKFYRSEDYRTRESSGTGLGLYVAHKLSSKIGTKIVMKSRLNFGSTFSITLPSEK